MVKATIHSAETHEQIMALRPLMQAFHKLAQLPGEYDIGLEGRLLGLIEAGIAFVFYATDEAGTPIATLAGIVSADLFTGTQIAQELFWYVSEDARGTSAGRQLLDTFERMAAEMEAKELRLMALSHLAPDRVGKIYSRRGYAPREIVWEKKAN